MAQSSLLPHPLPHFSVGLGSHWAVSDPGYCCCIWSWHWLAFLLELGPVSSSRTSLVISCLTMTTIPRAVLLVLLGAVGTRPWQARPLPCWPCYHTQLLAPSSLGTIWPPLPLDAYLFIPLLLLSLPNQASVSIPHLIYLLSEPPLSHPLASTHPLTCWQAVSLLLSSLGCVNHGLALQWCEVIREDSAVSGRGHSHQVDGKCQGNCQGWITAHPVLLSSPRHFWSSPLFSWRSQDFPGTTVLLGAHCDITGLIWNTKSSAVRQKHCGLRVICS